MTNDNVTLREVYALIDKHSTAMLAEVHLLREELQAYIAAHDMEHINERREHASNVRWSITTAVAFSGMVIAALTVLLR